ncbi:hypothetical protein SAMN02745165_03626 [Malonomonas rubra DSM 5091]|uniref:LTXXQ motif family protein n=1 Tax=Malonomonas rubra DSM 5091 TaxID=1122189 RepID=A0A1M6NJ02_MALRU|nr:hypothetical protein [Malonomonas rubra]SHJ95715.1 hypothetical protein SAMN02745165_03626 [Malonomonas rubra DSM 5091]
MRKFVTLLIALLVMAFLFPATGLTAQEDSSSTEKGVSREMSPFLITGKMPHLTKLLIKQWDNPELNLSTEQKDKLLVVRKETITGVKALTKKITPLEKQVVEGIFAKQAPEDLGPLVQAIAKLKAEATMVHLRCIYETSKILDAQQLEFLMN